MPRPEAGILFEMEGDQASVTVRLYSNNGEGAVFLKYEYTLLERGAVVRLHQSVPSENHLLDCETGSFVEGLRLVLQPLLTRYHCDLDLFSPRDDSPRGVPLEWFTTVARLVRECRSRCECLVLPGRPDLAILPSIIGRGMRQVLCLTDRSISTVLPTFLKIEKCSPIEIEMTTQEHVRQLTKEVSEIIKGWQDNDYRIPALKITDTCYCVGSLSHEELFTCLCHRVEPCLQRTVNTLSRKVELFIGRPSDDRVLCIKYDMYAICMYDMLPNGNNETLKFVPW